LAVPTTSAPSERIFALVGAVANAQRSSLSPRVVDKTIFVYENVSVSVQSDIVIAGDFNQQCLKILLLRPLYGFTQIVRQPTRGTNMLDQVFVYDIVRVISSVIKSDHKAIVAYSERRKVAPANNSTRVRYRKVTPSKHAAFLRHVSEDMLMTSHSWPPPPVR